MAESVVCQGSRLGRRRWLAFGVVASVLVGGGGACATHQAPQDPAALGCLLVEAADSTDGSWPLRVAMDTDGSSLVIPHPGFPTSRVDRFVVDQIGETLIRLDCRGRPQPSLAADWSVDDQGRTWSFRLRRDARFYDETQVVAGDVARSFREVAAPRPWAISDGYLVGWAGIRSARVKGDTAIVLEFIHASQSVPRVLAHPALITIKRNAAGPVGSGAFHLGRTPQGGGVSLASPSAARVLVNSVAGDARDALDRGVDLLVTGDVRALAYAAGLDEYQALPLPWDRVYVIVMPEADDRIQEAAADPYLPGIVRATARQPVSEAWWRRLGECSLPPVGAPRASENGRLVYDAADEVARNVAERVIAVIGTGAGERLIAKGLESEAFRRTMVAGLDRGYVVQLPAAPVAPCLSAGNLVQYAPWLDIAGAEPAIYPAVETRPHAVVRPGRVTGRLVLEWGGALRVLPDGRGSQ